MEKKGAQEEQAKGHWREKWKGRKKTTTGGKSSLPPARGV